MPKERLALSPEKRESSIMNYNFPVLNFQSNYEKNIYPDLILIER